MSIFLAGLIAVMDWGLARDLADPPDPKGTRVGTRGYWAPEQAAGQPDVDARADVFSLGATLCEMLTGHPVPEKTGPAATGPDVDEALARVNRCAEEFKLPAELLIIVRKCLEPKPEHRWLNARDLTLELDKYLKGADERLEKTRIELAASNARVEAGKETTRQQRRVLWATTTALALAAFLLIGAVFATQTFAYLASQREQERDRAITQSRRVRETLDTVISDPAIAWLSTQRELTTKQIAFIEQVVLKRYQEFASEETSDEEGRYLQAVAHYRVGYLFHRLGRGQEADAPYARAIQLFAELHRDCPGNFLYTNDYASSLNNRGMLLVAGGKRAEGKDLVRQAIEVREKMITQSQEADYRRQLVANYSNLGKYTLEENLLSEAEGWMRKAIVLQDKLLKEDSDNP